MEKSVAYSVVARKNFKDPEGSSLYYAQAQARGEMGIREMAERIQQMCTVTRADTMAVLISLGDVMREGLKGGEIVRLGDLGSFQIGLSSEGCETEEEYHSGLIRKARINFRPGADLSDILGNLSYERVAVKSKAEEEPEPEPEPGV